MSRPVEVEVEAEAEEPGGGRRRRFNADPITSRKTRCGGDGTGARPDWQARLRGEDLPSRLTASDEPQSQAEPRMWKRCKCTY